MTCIAFLVFILTVFLACLCLHGFSSFTSDHPSTCVLGCSSFSSSLLLLCILFCTCSWLEQTPFLLILLILLSPFSLQGLNLGLFTHLVYVPSLGRNILENIRCRHFFFFRLNLCKLGLVISLDGTEPIQDKSPVFGRLLLWEVHLNARWFGFKHRLFAKNLFMTW